MSVQNILNTFYEKHTATYTVSGGVVGTATIDFYYLNNIVFVHLKPFSANGTSANAITYTLSSSAIPSKYTKLGGGRKLLTLANNAVQVDGVVTFTGNFSSFTFSQVPPTNFTGTSGIVDDVLVLSSSS